MKIYITFRDTKLTLPAMNTRELVQDIIGNDAQIPAENPALKSMATYKSASEILNRTYIALGRKRVANFQSSGSTKQKINVKHLPFSSTTI